MPDSDRIRVLIVENEGLVGCDLATTLVGLGYEVAGLCRHGEEALQLADDLRPDVVLMDVQLAGQLDGIETARQLVKNNPVAVIYLTACAETTQGSPFTDYPGEAANVPAGQYGHSENWRDENVAGIADLLDFFPLRLDIRPLLIAFPSNKFEYRLSCEGPNDGRNHLRWRGRFAGITAKTNVTNYYSSGEDVLDKSDGTWPNLGVSKAWVYQEMAKGRDDATMAIFLLSFYNVIAAYNIQGGWGINHTYEKRVDGRIYWPLKDDVDALSADSLRTKPLFKPFSEPDLTDPAKGSTKASDPYTRSKTLSEAIPALSDATGKVQVRVFLENQIDLMTLRTFDPDDDSIVYWPSIRLGNNDWHHGDYRDVAFFFNHALYESWIKVGDLK